MAVGNYSLGVVSILYTITALSYHRAGKYGLALAFLAYAIANIGLVMEGRS